MTSLYRNIIPGFFNSILHNPSNVTEDLDFIIASTSHKCINQGFVQAIFICESVSPITTVQWFTQYALDRYRVLNSVSVEAIFSLITKIGPTPCHDIEPHTTTRHLPCFTVFTVYHPGLNLWLMRHRTYFFATDPSRLYLLLSAHSTDFQKESEWFLCIFWQTNLLWWFLFYASGFCTA